LGLRLRLGRAGGEEASAQGGDGDGAERESHPIILYESAARWFVKRRYCRGFRRNGSSETTK
jgi:hypothetical protein